MPPSSEFDVQSLSASVGPMPGEPTTALTPEVLSVLLQLPGLVASVKHWVQMDGYVEYTIVVERWARIGDAYPSSGITGTLVGESQHRYSSFRELHDSIGDELGLRFNAPKTLPMLKDASFVKEERKIKLSAYLNAALLVVQAREIEMPEPLREFLNIEPTSKPTLSPTLSVKRKPLGPLVANGATLVVTNGVTMFEAQRNWLKSKINGLGADGPSSPAKESLPPSPIKASLPASPIKVEVEGGKVGAASAESWAASAENWLSGVFASRRDEAAANQAAEEENAPPLTTTEEAKPSGMAVSPDGTLVPWPARVSKDGRASCLSGRSGSPAFGRFLCISHRKSPVKPAVKA